jgi:TolA-binding protein
VDKTMANRNLLKEAIADAKSVKEAAIANAKAALEEAFTPYLKEKFSAKLAEMETEEGMYEEDDKEMEENYSEGEVEEMSNYTEEKRTEKMREKPEVEEMDLDELLAELDEEMSKEKEMEETLNEAEEETEEEESEEVEGEEDDEIDLEDMTEDELKDLIEDVIADMVRAGELEAGEKFEAGEDEGEEEEEIDFEEEDEEEIVSERKHYGGNKGDKPRKSTAKEKDELLKEEEEVSEIIDPVSIIITTIASILGASGGAAAIMSKLEKMASKDPGGKADKVYKFLTSLGKAGSDAAGSSVKEMEDEIEELASTLSETKLLNAKLLYTNKIFRAKNLNETQKVKVLEAFDKATSVRDAKLIYETLTTVKETKTAVTESMRGMASKAAGMAPEKKPILEVNDQFARWQILAGIKRN